METVPRAVGTEQASLVRAGSVQKDRPDLRPVGSTENDLRESQGLKVLGVPRSYTAKDRLQPYVPEGLIRFRTPRQPIAYPGREQTPQAKPPKPKTKG